MKESSRPCVGRYSLGNIFLQREKYIRLCYCRLIPDISQSERSLGTAPTQVRDDPSSRLEGLEEDEEITADTEKETNRETEREIIVTLCLRLYPMDMGWEKKTLAYIKCNVCLKYFLFVR